MCRHACCPVRVEQGERYCPKHKHLYETTENARRGSAASRGYDSNWRRLRQCVLAQDPICKWPGCTQAATDVDHIVPKSRGGTDDIENLQGLCHEHHSVKTAREDGGFGNTGVGGSKSL
ncbi:MAG: HNH endonuclease signature motif containing protein [Elusimicrobiales bacterium]|nr:HNH endonuclease signature motif containing protein [Elusimicrobiales bacterium]